VINLGLDRATVKNGPGESISSHENLLRESL
jgi:hypothetical protein